MLIDKNNLNKLATYGIPAALLVLALLPLPYGYYTFLRIVVTICAAIVAYELYASEKLRLMSFLFIGIAVLFNPVIPIALNRSLWTPIDVVVAAIFCLGLYLSGRK